MGRCLMLVSARADAALREEVAAEGRPCPEYLRMEQRHHVQLLDWSSLRSRAVGRSTRHSLAHARAALSKLPQFDAVFSDGEHVGVPLAIGMRAKRLDTPHLMLGHHLTTASKRPIFQLLRPQDQVSRILVHSRRQLELAIAGLSIPRQKLMFVPYGVDSDFWSPRPADEEALVVSVGREHRDYRTLASACSNLPARVFVAAGSLFSPGARHAHPDAWPANFEVAFAEPAALRELYARAMVVVVPLVPNDFQAGVSVILEAMAMGKPVVVTATAGQRDLIVNGVTGVLVPPSDPSTLQDVVAFLLAAPHERRRLGANAREAARSLFSLDAYADALARHLREICGQELAAAVPAPLCPTPDRDDHPMFSLGNNH
jgi:glycosyltransferase involved in cell wall biosynthesis